MVTVTRDGVETKPVWCEASPVVKISYLVLSYFIISLFLIIKKVFPKFLQVLTSNCQ